MSRAVPRFRRQNPPLPPPAANLFQVQLIGVLEGQLTINNFYYWDSGATLSATSEQDLAVAFIGIGNLTTFLAACSADLVITAIKVQCLTTPTRMPYVDTIAGGVGAIGGGHEPTTVSCVISRYSGIKGQAGRGRVYMPAVPTVWVTGSAVTAGAGITAYGNVATMMKVTFTSGGSPTYVPMQVSKRNRTANFVLGASPVLNTDFRPLLGNTRRRRIGRGK
jgi:hypothetical protein